MTNIMCALFIMRYDLNLFIIRANTPYFVIQLKIHRYAHRGRKLSLFLLLPGS